MCSTHFILIYLGSISDYRHTLRCKRQIWNDEPELMPKKKKDQIPCRSSNNLYAFACYSRFRDFNRKNTSVIYWLCLLSNCINLEARKRPVQTACHRPDSPWVTLITSNVFNVKQFGLALQSSHFYFEGFSFFHLESRFRCSMKPERKSCLLT